MLPTARFAYNTSVNASAGFTPFYAVHLKHPRLPSDVDRPILSVGGSIDDVPRRTAASVEHFASSRESLLLRLRENIASAQAKQARQANKHNRGNTNVYSVSDLVYVHRSVLRKGPGGPSKLNRPWMGPFPIKKIVSPVDYELELPDDWDIHPVIYTGKLIPEDAQQARAPEAPQSDLQQQGDRSDEASPASSRLGPSTDQDHQQAAPAGSSCENSPPDGDPSHVEPQSGQRRSARLAQRAQVSFKSLLVLTKTSSQKPALRSLDLVPLSKTIRAGSKSLVDIAQLARDTRQFTTKLSHLLAQRKSRSALVWAWINITTRSLRIRLGRARLRMRHRRLTRRLSPSAGLRAAASSTF